MIPPELTLGKSYMKKVTKLTQNRGANQKAGRLEQLINSERYEEAFNTCARRPRIVQGIRPETALALYVGLKLAKYGRAQEDARDFRLISLQAMKHSLTSEQYNQLLDSYSGADFLKPYISTETAKDIAEQVISRFYPEKKS
jgi:hypothetical protein